MASNIVNFICPVCQTLLQVDSPVLEGEPDKRTAFSVPAEIATAIIGTPVTCEQCFTSFTVQPNQPKFVVLRLIEV